MCLLSDLKYIWTQSKVLLALAFRSIMNTYSSAALESCFPYKLMTWWTNWYCSQVWIIPPLKGKKKRGGKQKSYYVQTHEEIAQLTWSLCSAPKVYSKAFWNEWEVSLDCNQLQGWPPAPFWKCLLSKEQKAVRTGMGSMFIYLGRGSPLGKHHHHHLLSYYLSTCTPRTLQGKAIPTPKP